MQRFNDPVEVEAVIAPYVEEGEQIRHLGFGRLNPPFWVSIPLYALGGGGSVWHSIVRYLVALTDRRFVALRFKGTDMEIVETRAWPLVALPPIKISTGGFWTQIEIADAAKPFKAKFYNNEMPDQRAHAQAIAAALTDRATPV